MKNCTTQRHKATKKRNVLIYMNFLMASWLCAREIGAVIGKDKTE